MLLKCRDGFARYVIQCPPGCEVRVDEDGTDFLLVPGADEPGVPYWLFDQILIEAARSETFGLRVLSFTPLN